jgi:hypothetical protein
MTNKVRYLGDVACGPSPAIFGDLAKLRADSDMGMCVFYDNDFLTAPVLASATSQGEFFSYQDANVTIAPKAVNDTDKELGVLQIAVLDTDNDEGSVQFSGAIAGATNGNQIRLSANRNATGNTSKVGYEARYAVNELSADDVSTMCGLVEGPLVTVIADDNTGDIKGSTSFFGFRSLNTDPQNMDAIFQDTGSAAPVTVLANAATLVEGTYKKLGFLFDPYELDATKAATYFADGVAVAYVNTTQVDASTFPEDEGMVPFVLGKSYSAATSGTVSIDRVTFFMYKNEVQG